MLNDLYVKSMYRRKGHAGSLINHLIESAKSLWVPKLILKTQTNNKAAIELYQKFSFAFEKDFISMVHPIG
ncbi:MAG: GNAT family N-acetyltransferase [Pseudomonadota bacterium]